MPHLLQERNALGELPLHVACQIIKKDTRHIARIRVAEPCPDDDNDNDNDDNWPSLLNRSSPIQLLCHLYPGAGFQASNATGNHTNQCGTTYTIQRGPIPLEVFLHAVAQPQPFGGITSAFTTSTSTTACGGTSNSRMEELSQDLLCLVQTAPRALETRDPNTHRFLPFVIPLLHSRNGWNSPHDTTRPAQLLTLSYTLLRTHPMVLHQHCIDPNADLCSTAYEVVLKQRLERAYARIRELETSLQRQVNRKEEGEEER
jgi:hypothetical protein